MIQTGQKKKKNSVNSFWHLHNVIPGANVCFQVQTVNRSQQYAHTGLNPISGPKRHLDNMIKINLKTRTEKH